MLLQLRYLSFAVGLGIAVALPTFAFDENAPQNNINPAGAINPPGVAGVVAGLDMLQAASNKFSRANGLRLVKLMEKESARSEERATKLAEAKRQMSELFSLKNEEIDVDDAVSVRLIGIQAIAKLLATSSSEECRAVVSAFNGNAKFGLSKLLREDPEWQNSSITESPDRLNILRGSHPLSAHLAVAFGYLPASLFED